MEKYFEISMRKELFGSFLGANIFLQQPQKWKSKSKQKKKNQDKQKAATKLIHKKQATIDPILHTQEQDKMSIWEYNEFQLFLIHSCLTQKLKAMINT